MIALGLVLLAARAAADEPDPLWFAGSRVDGGWTVNWAIYEDHTWARTESVSETELPLRAPGPVPEWTTRRGRAVAAARRSGLVVGVIPDERWVALRGELEAAEAQIAQYGRFGTSYSAHPTLLEFVLAWGGRESRLPVVDPMYPEGPGPWQERLGLPLPLATLTKGPGGDGWETPRRVEPRSCSVVLHRVGGWPNRPLLPWPDDLVALRPAEGSSVWFTILDGPSCSALRERAAAGHFRHGAGRWDAHVEDWLPSESQMLTRLQAPFPPRP